MENGTWVDTFMAIAIMAISFGIGINLKFKDFRRVILRPKAVITGLAFQMILLPAVAFLLIAFWNINPIYKVGFILIAACPGGTLSNFITFILNGRVALSVSMTAFNSFLILFTIPLIMKLAFNTFLGEDQGELSLSFWQTFKEIFTSVLLPVTSGIVVNEVTSEKFSESIRKPLRYLITGILVAVVVVVIWFDEEGQITHVADNLELFIPLFLLNISTIFIGYLGAKAMKLKHESSYTIAIEMGLQNSALAIFIANKVIDEPGMALMPILYGSFSLITTWGLAYLLKVRFRPREISTG